MKTIGAALLGFAVCLLLGTVSVDPSGNACVGKVCYVPVLVVDGGFTLNGAMNCPNGAEVPSTCISGTVAAGGSSPQLQFNSGGVLGGVSKVGSADGLHETYTCEASTPSTSSGVSTQFDFCPASGLPQSTLRADPPLGFPTPIGIQSPVSGWLGPTAPDMGFRVCHFPDGFGTSSYTVLEGTAIAAVNSGSNHNPTWDAGSPTLKHRWVGKTAGTTAHAWAGVSAGSTDPPIVPVLGFSTWMRWFVPAWDGKTATWVFNGFRNGSSAISGTTMPSAVPNAFYFGCDNDSSAGSVPLKACSNASGTATCQIVDGGATPFNCRAAGVVYDGWFYAAPNEGQIHWGVRQYIDGSGATNVSSGVLTTNQPVANGQLYWTQQMNAGDDAGAASVDDFDPGGECHIPPY